MRISLRRLFSPPRYISLPAAGINVSDRSVKAIELSEEPSGLRVSYYETQEIEKGIIEKGQIKDPQYLIDKLTLLRQKISTPFVNVALPEQQAYVFSTSIPFMAAESIRDSLAMQMERFVPIPVKDIIFDFDVVSVRGGEFEVQVVVIDRSVIYAYLDVFSQAGFDVVLFELDPQSAARALLDQKNNEAVLLVDFGDTHTGISVIRGGYMLFNTTSEITGMQFESAMEKALNVSSAEVKKLKYTYGIIPHKDTEAAIPELVSLTESLSKDIQKAIQYWQSQQTKQKNARASLSRVVMCGGNSYTPGLLAKLQESLPLPVTQGDPWTRIVSTNNTYVPVIPPDQALSYSSAIGLALASLHHD